MLIISDANQSISSGMLIFRIARYATWKFASLLTISLGCRRIRRPFAAASIFKFIFAVIGFSSIPRTNVLGCACFMSVLLFVLIVILSSTRPVQSIFHVSRIIYFPFHELWQKIWRWTASQKIYTAYSVALDKLLTRVKKVVASFRREAYILNLIYLYRTVASNSLLRL